MTDRGRRSESDARSFPFNLFRSQTRLLPGLLLAPAPWCGAALLYPVLLISRPRSHWLYLALAPAGAGQWMVALVLVRVVAVLAEPRHRELLLLTLLGDGVGNGSHFSKRTGMAGLSISSFVTGSRRFW